MAVPKNMAFGTAFIRGYCGKLLCSMLKDLKAAVLRSLRSSRSW
jgi:hypothetical protein